MNPRDLATIDADIKANNARTAALHVGLLGRPHTPDETEELKQLETAWYALHAERLEAPLPGEVAAGLTSDDDAWSAETVEYVRAHCPISRVVARTLDAFVARGALITHASVTSCNLTLTGNRTQPGVSWRVCGEVNGRMFEAKLMAWSNRGVFGNWTLQHGLAGEPDAALMSALGGTVCEVMPDGLTIQALA